MALGKIKADTLEHSTAGSLDTSYVVNGSAKASVDCTPSGTTNTTFNVSSATDGGTGITTINLTSSLSSATQPVQATIHNDGTENRCIVAQNTSASAVLTKAFAASNGTVTDGAADFSLVAHGDLA